MREGVAGLTRDKTVELDATGAVSLGRCSRRGDASATALVAFRRLHEPDRRTVALSCRLAVARHIDRALDPEQRVDALQRLNSERRNWRRFALRLGILGHIRHDEKRATRMDPAT